MSKPELFKGNGEESEWEYKFHSVIFFVHRSKTAICFFWASSAAMAMMDLRSNNFADLKPNMIFHNREKIHICMQQFCINLFWQVERKSCKLQILGSIPSGGFDLSNAYSIYVTSSFAVRSCCATSPPEFFGYTESIEWVIGKTIVGFMNRNVFWLSSLN